jgi:drug/metabolite transporter (DMT)-like permease
LALAAVSLFWGTTYLGIRISLEALPPLYLIAIRYTISGSIMLIGAKIAGVHLPTGSELRQTALCGIISIGIGNGCLAIAEQSIPSGLAALFITTAPFWMIGIDALLPHGAKPRGATLRGLLVGLAGVAYLILPTTIHEGFGGRTLIGFGILQIGNAGWILGALLQRRVPTRAHPFVAGAVQQLATGLTMFIPAAIFEKMPHSIPLRPGLAVVYLVFFGSIVGYSSFVYSMARLPVAMVSIYTYVNPVVAVFLGWLFFREPFGTRELTAMLVIFFGIALVKWSESVKKTKVEATA